MTKIDSWWFKKKLSSLKVSQTQLAKLMGYKNRSSITYMFQGRGEMSLRDAVFFSKFFDLPLKTILSKALGSKAMREAEQKGIGARLLT